MRHRKAGRKLGRDSSHRRAMFRNLIGNLLLNERIETTEAKAKELRRIADRMVTLALRLGADLSVDVNQLSEEDRDKILARRTHAQRVANRFVPRYLTRTKVNGEYENVDVIYKLFHELAPRFQSRAAALGKQGGYTRIIKKGPRRGDHAAMTYVELMPAMEGLSNTSSAAD